MLDTTTLYTSVSAGGEWVVAEEVFGTSVHIRT